MSNLISCQSISKSFGAQTLFEDITLGISSGERLGLIGPNGAGKSTLLKIFAGLEEVDTGKLFIRKNLRLVFLAQAESFVAGEDIESALYRSLESKTHDSQSFTQVQKMAAKCGFFDLSQKVDSLSGGWLKRLAISCALIKEPDLLFLDEPTNHLDMEGILWLEDLLSNSSFAFAVITHDRHFLNTVTNRIIELSAQYPDGYLRVEGKFEDFLRRKSELLTMQNKQETVLGNKLRREIEWLSRGPKARTTKAQYRIDEAAKLKNTFQDTKHRNAQGKAIDLSFDSTGRKTKKLLTARNISKVLGGKTIFEKLDLTLTPNMCLGLLGNNGTGKSTLINVLAGNIVSDTGSVDKVDGLKVILFDQKREGLNKNQTLRRALAPDGDSVLYNDRPLHVVSWAKKFLFRPDQLDMPVSRLSGGEQARILIAELMRQPADILLLDEPTNDLDIPSLEVLEDSLADFKGVVVLVTHDRFLLDRLADYVLGFDGNGNCERYADFRQWLEDLEIKKNQQSASKSQAVQKANQTKPKNKITLGEKIELEKMEQRIFEAEQELDICHQRLSDESIQSNPATLADCCAKLEVAQKKVDNLYSRWQELEGKIAN
nr:ABC-F family ATP-binding cassette domain-containing protein [Desulfobulbaceae bacterium]